MTAGESSELLTAGESNEQLTVGKTKKQLQLTADESNEWAGAGEEGLIC